MLAARRRRRRRQCRRSLLIFASSKSARLAKKKGGGGRRRDSAAIAAVRINGRRSIFEIVGDGGVCRSIVRLLAERMSCNNEQHKSKIRLVFFSRFDG